MGRIMRLSRDFLEILMNFLAVLCLETALDASFGGMNTPLWALLMPAALPFLFYGLRKMTAFLPVFLLAHPAAVCLLIFAAGALKLGFMWRMAFSVIGSFYAVHSIRVRVTRKECGEGEISAFPAGILAAVSFFLCSYVRQDKGCERVLWISFLFVLLYLIQRYLDNFASYLRMNRSSTGAMPEKSIFRAGMTASGIYSLLSVAALILLTGTPVVGWLSSLVRKAGKALAYGIFWLLTLLAGENEAGTVPPENNPVIGMKAGMVSESPLWMRILNQIVTFAVTAVLIAGALAALFLLFRFIARGFYARKKGGRQLRLDGFVEEEERIFEHGTRRKTGLPFLGGSPAQRIRKIFLRTVQSAFSPEKGGRKAGTGSRGAVQSSDSLQAMTARELADAAGSLERADMAGEKFRRLAELYERARYTQEELNGQDVRLAGKLSREIAHTIK